MEYEDAMSAALTVCEVAGNKEEAAEFLAMLGLVEGGTFVVPRDPLLEILNIKEVSSPGAGWKGAYQ